MGHVPQRTSDPQAGRPSEGSDDSQAAGVDVGGTFTDVVALTAERPRAVKVPTTPADQSEGVESGLNAAGCGRFTGLLAHGTTAATNAVLERTLARTVLVVTDGFADVLAIARQDRPSLYDLAVTRPDPLVPSELVVTARERVAGDGNVITALDAHEVNRVTDAVAARGPEAVAVSLLFSYAHPEHEATLCAALERLNVPVTRSSVLLPEFREYERTSTCALNAAVAPVISRYLDRLRQRLPAALITVMTSGGGTAGLDFAASRPVHTLLSGPAAGVVAAGAIAQAAGFDDAVSFDMGGTSTDVCLIEAGMPELSQDSEIDGLPFRTPAVGIHTVGAGGGSIAYLDAGAALRVGPRSAGARPGPACYGLGGSEPTVTDAHCVLGHLDPERALGDGSLRLDRAAAVKAVETLPHSAGGAPGMLTVVRATMARALRRVTTERGVSPSALALVAYGGAGPLHAVALARELDCAAVIVPPAPGVLSALGLLLAEPRHEASRTVVARASDDLEPTWKALEAAAGEELASQGIATKVELSRHADVRYAGQSHELRVDARRGADLAEALADAHTRAYGYAVTDEPVEVVTLRVTATGVPALAFPPVDWDLGEVGPDRRRDIGIEGETVAARVLDRAGLQPGDVVDGPALIEQPDATTLLAAGDGAEVDDHANLLIRLR